MSRAPLSGMLVWDTQTGIVISHLKSGTTGNIVFSGNQGTITLINGQHFFAYDGFNGIMLHKGQLQLPNTHQLGSQWTHDGCLQFATSFETDGELTVNIQEFQLASDHPHLTVKSFPVLPLGGGFSFCSASFHASFVTKTTVIILDILGSKFLLCTKSPQPLYVPQGQFSPDGSFFMCETLEYKHSICIWRNTPTGYVPWSTLQPRLPFDKFLFSPTMISIVTWGPEGIQLLCPDDSPTPLSSDSFRPLNLHLDDLLACSMDGAYIATAQQRNGVITVHDSLSGALQWSIHTDVEIQDFGIVNNTIFVASGHGLITWDLEVGGRVTSGGSYYTSHRYMESVENLVLSNDCSKIAFTARKTVFLYDITAQAMLVEYKLIGVVTTIQFSPDGYHLHVFWDAHPQPQSSPSHLTVFKMDGHTVSMITECLEGMGSQVWHHSEFHGYYRIGYDWVVDLSGCKHLWLPPSWRTKDRSNRRWKGNFLVLVGNQQQMPMIIELHPFPEHFLSPSSTPGHLWKLLSPATPGLAL